ncbi:MAG: hypothetical protein IH983_00690 [Planctomycetes bacterium]|nr:hypothetical protein [Planctomycetota bacterium]
MMRSRGPNLRLDPGWLFILAGLTACAAGILVPAQQDLGALRGQLAQLGDHETISDAQLSAHAEFLRQLHHGDPTLIRRLAAAQLNLMPQGKTPVLLAPSRTANVTDWIDATVQPKAQQPEPRSDSLLTRMTNGPYRLWIFANGVLCVFVGLLLNPGPSPNKQLRSLIVSRWRVEGAGRDGDALAAESVATFGDDSPQQAGNETC